MRDVPSIAKTGPPDLGDALARRTLALFIGADLPREATGLPSRTDLAHDLARREERARSRVDESLSLAEVAQRVSQAGNRFEFTAFIRDALDTIGKSPRPFHRRIVELVKQHQIETIITTAYDNLLELAFQEAGIPINRVVRGSDVSFINPDRPTLIKLYGDAQQPDTLVVTEDDHYGLWRDRDKEDLLDQVRAVLRKQTVLFLGYNLTDPDFNLLWREVLDRAGRFARTAYAVWPDLPEDEVRMWRDRGIVIFDVGPWEILESIDTSSAHDPLLIPEKLIDHYNRAVKNKVWQQRMPSKRFVIKESKASFEKKLELFVTFVNRVGLDGDDKSDYTPLLMPRLGWRVLRRRRPESERRCLPYTDREQKEWEFISNIEEADSIKLTIDPLQGLSLELTEKEQGLWVTINPEGDRDSVTVFENGHWIHKGWRHIPADPKGRDILSAWLANLSQEEADQKSAKSTEQPTSAEQFVPKIDVPTSESSMEGKDMDYERGLAALKQLAEGTDWYQDFTVHEAPLRENLRDERRYGPSEQTRRDRTRIVDQLNALALEHVGISFNDLCMGKQPPPRSSTEVKGDEAITGAEPVYGVGNHWAVLVGVNEYEDGANYGQLHVCVKDVEAIRDQLVANDFDPARIRLLTDETSELPTRDNILVALKAVADATEPDDLLLFYYSGHGDEVSGESYLVARNGRRLVLSDTAVRLSRVKEIVEDAPARAKVIILDACHSGADIGGKGPRPMTAEFIRRVFEEAEGLAVLASCKQGQLSYEWRENERSVFTHYLLEGLSGAADRDEKGFVTVQDASRHVTNGVKLWASQRNVGQTPTLQYAVAGDIILVQYQ
jgi:hypothetical protein